MKNEIISIESVKVFKTIKVILLILYHVLVLDSHPSLVQLKPVTIEVHSTLSRLISNL